MPLYIIDNAICQCSQSETPSILQVKSQTLVKIQDKKIATENDKPTIPFGCCNNDPKKLCTPKLQQWQDTAESTSIYGQKCLIEASYIMCDMGGKVTVSNHTQIHTPVDKK